LDVHAHRHPLPGDLQTPGSAELIMTQRVFSHDGPGITLILPAYNEVKSIAGTIAEVTRYFQTRNLSYEIIVSADGDDGTREVVAGLAEQDPRIKVIGQSERLGKGRGIRKAVELANGAIIGFADADNKVPIDEYEKLQLYLDDGFDLVIGSRALDKSRIERKQPLYRRLGSKGFAVFMHGVVGLKNIRDTQCGFKFFKHDVAKELFHRQKTDGYMFDVEILALAQQLSYSMKEVPIRWHDDGDSRLQLISDNVRHAIDIFRIRRAIKREMRANSVTDESDFDSTSEVCQGTARR
jgi:dolichyl-phosphate beta-glucosyltransferase